MDRPDAREMIEDIVSAVRVGGSRGGIDLDAWEHDFVSDMEDAATDGLWSPTEGQQASLRAIWDRI